jgi:hypothetical protein
MTPRPIQTVKVVTCDLATREALERRKRSARERNDAISRRVTDLLTDDEFLRVERDLERPALSGRWRHRRRARPLPWARDR